MMARGEGKGGGGDYSREAVNRRSTAIIRVACENIRFSSLFAAGDVSRYITISCYVFSEWIKLLHMLHLRLKLNTFK